MKIKSCIKSAAVAAAACLLISPSVDNHGSIVFEAVPSRNLHNSRIEENKSGNRVYSIADLTYQDLKLEYITDMALSFNYPSSALLRDDTKKYTVKRSEYGFVKSGGSLGNGCAQFFKKEHGVNIGTVRSLWLGSCGDLGSFTIEFRFKPTVIRDGSVLFARTGYFSGRKRGIEITIRNGRAVASFFGVFIKPGYKAFDVILSKGRRINAGKWYHFAVSFDRISGKLVKSLDNMEEDVLFLTSSGEPFNGVMEPTFGYINKKGDLACKDSPDAVIGKNYSGYMDEFRIAYRSYDSLDSATDIAYRNYSNTASAGRIPYNVEGIVTSPVYSFEDTGTRVTEFRWDEELRRNTFIWMQFRISDQKFSEDDVHIKWYRITNGQRNIYLKKTPSGEFLRGKFYQWRAHLVASPDGKSSPLLWNVRMDYQPDRAPNPPQFVQVAAVGDCSVTLRWKKSLESDVHGYRIYYGADPSKYDGIISQVDGKKITNAMARGEYIEVTINKKVIEENRVLDKKALLSFPHLKNTVLYFFTVTVFDSYKPDTTCNHESKPSKQVAGRPYAGSEIN